MFVSGINVKIESRVNQLLLLMKLYIYNHGYKTSYFFVTCLKLVYDNDDYKKGMSVCVKNKTFRFDPGIYR